MTMKMLKEFETLCLRALTAFLCLLILVQSCASQKKLQQIRAQKDGVEISPISDADDSLAASENIQSEAISKVDSLPQDKPIIMNAILDEETGEMVATEELMASMIVSRRYQVAERNGKIDLPFEILVPKRLQDSKWQLRLVPDLTLSGIGYRDTTALEPVYITGEEYRNRQLRGYEQYERFLGRIITDSSRLVYRFQLEQFLKRNLPEVYKLKTDSTYVTETDFYSRYDVSAQEALDHYTKGWLVNSNERLIADKDRRFRRYVKSPIVEEGIRLDTVLVNPDGDCIYRYVQTIDTRKDLKYAYIALEGSIWDQDQELYIMPRTDSIEYPVSSLSHFVKDITRYKMKTVWRRQEANSSYNISFDIGRDRIDPQLGSNAAELERIKANLRSVLNDDVFDLDSIIVSASCSPEGRYAYNRKLSQGRTSNVCDYFSSFMREYVASVKAERGFSVDEAGNVVHEQNIAAVPLVARHTPENWELLDRLVGSDPSMDAEARNSYSRLASAYASDPDRRELMMRRESWFSYVKDELYPKLRVVNFNFNLHRKGMVEEFVRTEEVDTLYARGVQLLRDRDYDAALEILSGYDDYNSAIAYMAKDRNRSALDCLEKEEETADVLYLKAILLSRFARDEEACDCYKRACEMDGSYVFRGNLDPEITLLIKKFGLNKELGL